MARNMLKDVDVENLVHELSPVALAVIGLLSAYLSMRNRKRLQRMETENRVHRAKVDRNGARHEP